MNIQPFKLERYFAQYEFSTKYLISSSDCESLRLDELLQMASPMSLDMWQKLSLGYTESQGSPLLRNEVSKLYQGISSNNILISAPEEAIFIAMQSLLQPGDHVIAIAPAYQSLHEIAISIGCNISLLNIRSAGDHWTFPITDLEALINEKTRLIIINFPHNPTGFLPTIEQYKTIFNIAQKHNLYVFSDEMYRLLEYDLNLRLPSASEIYPNAISLSGLSKSFSLPGLRIGWLTTQKNELIQKFINYKDYTTICNSAPSEILAIIALQNKDFILNRNLQIIKNNLEIAQTLFENHPKLIRWIPSLAGSVAFPEWLGSENVEKFCQMAIQQHGIMIVPGSMFDHPGNHFRLGLGRINFREAIEHLDEFLLSLR